jgi:TetR/AcrR family transcriptional regulator, repressor for uid operon
MQTTKRAQKKTKGKASRERIIDAAGKLFGSKGFHATTTAELTAEAKVSIAQIYRVFASKDDIVIAIVEQRMRAMGMEMHAIFDAVKRGELSTFEAMKAMVASLLADREVGLVFEILAEAGRNPAVAERVASLTTFYRDGIYHLATFARPDSPPAEIEAYVNVMLACLIGLYYRPVLSTTSAETSHNVACLMMRVLRLPDQPLI